MKIQLQLYILVVLASVSGAKVAVAKSQHGQQPEAGQAVVKFVGDLKYSVFCKAVVTDNVNLLDRSILRQVGKIADSPRLVLQKVTADSGILCNGKTLQEFAKLRQAESVQRYLDGA